MSVSPDLVLLTAQYPFGNKAETFLETEIHVLAERFRRVFVLPSHRGLTQRPLPERATLIEMPWLVPPGGGEKRKALLSREALQVMVATAGVAANWMPYLGWPRAYLDILATNIIKSRQLREFVNKQNLGEAIFYDYWFENCTVALALLRRAGVVKTALARAHRFDVYDESWGGRPVPFREFKASGMDAVFSVSEAGASYLSAKCPPLRTILGVSRLGVPCQLLPAAQPADVPLVVSCASLLPFKRVHLIPAVLAGLERPVRWVHFGDGPERDRVVAAAAKLPDRVHLELIGHVDNSAVLDFYRTYHVDAFISLSASEGLPVSMMEACSFGVPIVAVGVNGVPEIVTSCTGVLLSEDAGLEEMRAGLTQALDRDRFDRTQIRAFFAERFDARTNYNRFVDAIIALQQD